MFHANVLEKTRLNTAFRRVAYTGERSQLVLMTVPPGDSVGLETHEHVEQLFFIVSGHARAKVREDIIELAPGDVLIVPPNTPHDLITLGEEPLQLYTVYSPPNHLDRRVHGTHERARADVADEEFGHHVH
jgi:mannose-6-phosphate isomerase-like protein (cupin superfamily)